MSTMQREVPFSIEGVGIVPDDFYEHAERVIQHIPEEWDLVVIGPQLERDEHGYVTGYEGAGCHFRRDGKYVAFMVEHPRQLDAHQRGHRRINRWNFCIYKRIRTQ